MRGKSNLVESYTVNVENSACTISPQNAEIWPFRNCLPWTKLVHHEVFRDVNCFSWPGKTTITCYKSVKKLLWQNENSLLMDVEIPKFLGLKFMEKFWTDVFWILTKLAEFICADFSTFTVVSKNCSYDHFLII